MTDGTISESMTYGLVAISLTICAIPLLFIVYRVVTAPLRTWVPLLFFIGLIVLAQGASAIIGSEGMTGLIYILAGAGK